MFICLCYFVSLRLVTSIFISLIRSFNDDLYHNDRS